MAVQLCFSEDDADLFGKLTHCATHFSMLPETMFSLLASSSFTVQSMLCKTMSTPCSAEQ
jgi:hypothetical protein